MDNTQPLWCTANLECLGLSDLNAKVVLVAGIKGKGATVSALQHMLANTWYSVGAFINPMTYTEYD